MMSSPWLHKERPRFPSNNQYLSNSIQLSSAHALYHRVHRSKNIALQTRKELYFNKAKLRFGSRGHCEVREQLYVNEIIPKFSNEVFRQHFRMTKTTYETLERWLTPTLTRIGKKGRPMIPVRNQLLSVIWLLATPDSFR